MRRPFRLSGRTPVDSSSDPGRDEAALHAADQHDVRAVRAGDVDAFGLVIERHANDLRRVLSRFFREPADVDDLLQETLVRCFHSLESFDASRPLGPWMRKIAVNLALDEIRRRKRRHEVDAAEPVLAAQASPVSSDRAVIDRELREALDSEMEALPPDWSAVLRLRAMEDMSYAEIAETLDVPMGTVMSRLARARARLAQALAARFGAATAEEMP